MTTTEIVLYTTGGVVITCIVAVIAVFWAVGKAADQLEPYQDIYHEAEPPDEKEQIDMSKIKIYRIYYDPKDNHIDTLAGYVSELTIKITSENDLYKIEMLHPDKNRAGHCRSLTSEGLPKERINNQFNIMISTLLDLDQRDNEPHGRAILNEKE